MKHSILFFCLALFLLMGSVFAQDVKSAHPVVYQLPAAVNDSVRTILKKSWAPSLKDTVIIQYQREMPEGTVMQNDEIIQQKITEELRFLHNNLVQRKNITVIQFAEDGPGNKKLLEFNNLLNIDENNSLYDLLFRDHAALSVMLLPSGQCIYFSSNDKWAAFKFSSSIHNDLVKK